MSAAVIVDAVRTPIGRRAGALARWRADDLAAYTVRALMRRIGAAVNVDEVIAGCVMQVGEQALNIARRAALLADIPVAVPASTVDFQCGSGMHAVISGARQIAAGDAQTVLAFGVETMTRVPLGATRETYGEPYGDRFLARHEMISNGLSAERIAHLYGITRRDLDAFSFSSHARAAEATDQGYFAREITPVPSDPGADESAPGDLVMRDEGIRQDTSVQALSMLRPVFAADGMVTAGSSSQISDGAAALLLMSETAARSAGLVPRARILHIASVGSDPTLALTGPIDATRKLLTRAGLSITDIDFYEVNEAFAPVVLGWGRALDVPLERINPWGGAIALGHPLGCSGVRLITTLMNILERRDGRLGLATICCNGGLGLAVLIERLQRPTNL